MMSLVRILNPIYFCLLMQFLIGYNNDILCIHILFYQEKANKSINNASRKLEFRQHISQQKYKLSSPYGS